MAWSYEDIYQVCLGLESSRLSQQIRVGFLFHVAFPPFFFPSESATFFSPATLIPNHFGFDESYTGIIITMDHSGVLVSGQDAQGYELMRPAG